MPFIGYRYRYLSKKLFQKVKPAFVGSKSTSTDDVYQCFIETFDHTTLPSTNVYGAELYKRALENNDDMWFLYEACRVVRGFGGFEEIVDVIKLRGEHANAAQVKAVSAAESIEDLGSVFEKHVKPYL